MLNEKPVGEVDPKDLNPQLVILARQSRGLTQSELADKMKVGQGTVSKIEAGLGHPTQDELENLANVLHYPSHFFTQKRKVVGADISELYHRKHVVVSARTLNKVHACAAIRIMNIEDLLRSWEYHKSELPIMPIEEFDDNPEKIARTVRAALKLPPGPIVNMTKVVEDCGGIIIKMDMETRHIDGFSRRGDNLPPVFFLNQDLLPDRWRWTLAHELGHMVMHTEPSNKDIEDEANRFAGEFLAPAYELKPQLWELSIPKLAGLKRYWKISIQALLMRAKQLGIIEDWKQRQMFMKLSKAGFRLREPEELDPPTEPPQRIQQIIAFHKTNLGYTDDDLQTALATSIDDIYSIYLQGTTNMWEQISDIMEKEPPN
jgi:Zn-dependent peptidase ImmA (M78 family)/DNA-binding XRE family transcriptional regulator